MANRLRGLTIDLALNSVGLERGFKKLRGITDRTSKDLSNINRKLRLKPNSVVLLGSKTKLLSRAIKEGTRSLNELTTKFKGLEKGSNAAKLTESKIKSLTRTIDGLNRQLATTRTRFTQGLDARLNKGIVSLGAVAGATVYKFNDFNEGVAKIATLSKTTNIDGLRKQLIAVSNATGVSSKQIAEGWYQALSAGIKESADFTNEVKFMTTAAKLSAAGFGEMGSIVKILATTSQQTGLAVEQVSDKFLALQNAGIITTGEIAENFGKVLPLANNLGVSLDQVNATIATFTKQGIDAAQSTTLLRALFTAFNKPTSEAAKLLKEISGKSFPDFIKSGKSLGDAIKIVATRNENLFETFSNVRAAQAAAAFNTSEFNTQLNLQANALGATDKAFKRREGILGFQKAMNKLQNTIIKIGQGVAEQLIPVIENLGNWLKSVDLVAFGKSIAFVLKTLISLKVAIGIIKGLTAVMVAFNIAASPLLAIAGAIGGLATFFGLSNLGGLTPKLNQPSTTTTNNITNNYNNEPTKTETPQSTIREWNNSRFGVKEKANEGLGEEA